MLTEISGATIEVPRQHGASMLFYQKVVWLNTELVVFLDELTLDSSRLEQLP